MVRRKPGIQKITLANDGVVLPRRMKPVNNARPPSTGLSRIRRLLKTREPHICIVRGEGIGDVITTTPTVRALKQQFDKVRITYATNTKYLGGALVEALKHNPNIDQIIERELINEVDYDLVINLQCPCIHHEKRGNAPISRIDLFARHVGVELTDPRPQFFIQEKEIEDGESLLGPLTTEKLVLVQPSASTKRRSIDHRVVKQAITALYKDHGVRSVILTHSSDWATDTLWDNTPGGCVLKDLNIRGIAGVMVHCDLVLCPDSSILHLAGALDIPTVAMFGPTHPDARINHYKNAVEIWEVRGMAPCPCWYEHCPISETCWSRVTPEIITNKCVEHIGNRDKKKGRIHIQPSIIETEIV